MNIIIETERLILRPLRASDLDRLVAALNNFNVSQNTARIPFPYTRADADAFLALTQQASPGMLRLTIMRKDNPDTVCGGIGYEPAEGNAELGYWLAEHEWGKGFGGEAARAITDHAFRVAQYEMLTAGYRIGNEASRRILARLGFTPTAETMVYSKGAGADVPVMRMELSCAEWQSSGGRER